MGLVEGITEWLPVSSTGHMILVDEFVKMNVSETFWNMFLVVIQLGAILAVCVLFFYDLNPFSPSKGKEGRRDTWVLWGKIVLGCIPAAAIGLPLNDWMEEHFYNAPVVALALIVYGVLFIVIENWRANKRDQAALAGSFGARAWWRADDPLVRILPRPLRLPLQTMTITWTLAPSLRSRA